MVSWNTTRGMMNIGEAAQRTGLSAKTIRYYESVNLITASRDKNGYRQYGDVDIKELLFIKRLRGLGFKIADCNMLIEAVARTTATPDSERAQLTAELSALFEIKLRDIDDKLSELIVLRDSIKRSITDVKTNNSGTEFIRLLNRQT